MEKNIAIIGGGIMGVTTAFYLSRDARVQDGSVGVILVEANEIASGASGKAGGCVVICVLLCCILADLAI